MNVLNDEAFIYRWFCRTLSVRTSRVHGEISKFFFAVGDGDGGTTLASLSSRECVKLTESIIFLNREKKAVYATLFNNNNPPKYSTYKRDHEGISSKNSAISECLGAFPKLK